MMTSIRITEKARIKEQMDQLGSRLMAFWNFDQCDLEISYKRWEDPRTRSQNKLYWMWLEEMANYYSRRDSQFSKDDMHDLMRYHFLGSETKVIGNTELPPQLRSTADLKKPEMSEYLHKIEQWNTNNGLLVTIPADNEYMKYKEARQ